MASLGGAVAPAPVAWTDAVENMPSAISLAMPLPLSAYNQNQIWFPYIINQDGSSCVQAAEI